jgi:aldose 1-epimerase
MRFSISSPVQNGFHLITLKEDHSATEVAVLPAFGASLHAFNVLMDKKSFNIIDNYKNLEEAQKEAANSYKSSKLSPFPCRISNGKYSANENQYELKNKFIDGSAIHGLLYNKAFDVVDEFANENMASLVLKYDYDHDDEGYPFSYRCEIRYFLGPANRLKIQTTISNLSETEIPIADGWHPYFRFGGLVNNWLLHFNARAIIEFDDKLIPTGKLLEYNLFNESHPVGDIQLDNCFMIEPENGKPVCEIVNSSNGLKVGFFTDGSYPYLQIYTPSHRQSIAIENLSGAPDCFNNKMGLVLLKPRHSQTFTVQYQVTVGQKP